MRRLRIQFAIGVPLALASVWSHARVDYLVDTLAAQLPVLAIFLATAAFAVWMIVVTPRDEGSDDRPPVDRRLVISVVVGGCALYAIGLLQMPPWSEETWWIEVARRALGGHAFHPMGFKGDFPSNFQFWPIAGLMWLTGASYLSARLPGVVYAVGTALLVAGSVRYYVKERLLPLSLCFPLLSLWMVFLVHTGWSDVNIVPLLVAAQTYLLLRSLVDRSERSLMWLGLVGGVAFWTLYTPFLFALVVVALVVVMPRSVIDFRRKARFALCFAVTISATVGKAVQWPGMSLARHLKFLQGGEWAQRATSDGQPLETYWNSFMLIVERFQPQRVDWAPLNGIWLETTTLLFFAVGLLTACFGVGWLQRIVLFVPGGMMVLALIGTNPVGSPWRATCLAPLLFLFAAIGAHRVALLPRRWNRCRLSFAIAAVIVFAHVAVFTSGWVQALGKPLDRGATGWLSARLWRDHRATLEEAGTVVVTSDHLRKHLKDLSNGSLDAVLRREAEQIAPYLDRDDAVIMTFSRGNGSDPEARWLRSEMPSHDTQFVERLVVGPGGIQMTVFIAERKMTGVQ